MRRRHRRDRNRARPESVGIPSASLRLCLGPVPGQVLFLGRGRVGSCRDILFTNEEEDFAIPLVGACSGLCAGRVRHNGF